MRSFISHPADAYCISVAEQYQKFARLIIKSMKSGHANAEFVDEAISSAKALMKTKIVEWKKTRDENLTKNPYVPHAVVGAAITDGMANLFIGPQTPQKKHDDEKKAKKEEEDAE